VTDDLAIPAFLLRPNVRRLTNEEARNLNTPRRDWAPFRDHSNRPRPTVNPALFDRPELPVVVSVRHSDGSKSVLARYENFAALADAHDVVALPIQRVVCGDDETYVISVAKPWSLHYKPPAKPGEAPSPAPSGRSKVHVISALLQRPEGCTTKEVLAATGWPSVSMPAQAKAAGLILTKEKRDGATRYFGRHP